MNNLENYDFNVYGDSDTTICLTAYPLKWTYDEAYDGNYRMECDYSEGSWISLRLKFPEDLKTIEYLLDDLYINNYPLTDYDDWLTITENKEEYPQKIREFLDQLPENKLEEK